MVARAAGPAYPGGLGSCGRGGFAGGPLKDYIWAYPPRTISAMKYSTRIRPISYLKANAAEVFRQLTTLREPLVITQNGEAKAVIQDVASFEETQETLALLKILALGNRQIEAGKTVPVDAVIRRLRGRAARKAKA